MLVIAVELLTRRFVATSPQDRRAHEWPPHPNRLFSAMVAAWADLEGAGGAERAALEWLEAEPAPRIVASEATPRSVLTHFVPVNDTSVVGLSVTRRHYEKLEDAQRRLQTASTESRRAKALQAIEKARDVGKQVTNLGNANPADALRLVPAHRVRQARHYPSVSPERPTVHYVWPDSIPTVEIVAALDALLAGVTRIGHSSSMVTCRVVPEPNLEDLARPAWVPSPDGDELVRTTAAGQLRALEQSFLRHQASAPRTMPADMRRYRRVLSPDAGLGDEPTSDAAGEWFVFERVSGPRLPITAGARLAAAVRAALMSHAADPVVELISGHQGDGRPSAHPHLAVLPLPFVGTQHASGLILGFAVQLPRRSALLDQRDELLGALGRWEGADASGSYRIRLRLRGGQEVWFARRQEPIGTWTLSRSRWDRPSRVWCSVTPVALDRHPGDLASQDPAAARQAAEAAAATIRAACGHVGLPEPAAISITRDALLGGSRPARAFAPFRSGAAAPQRLLVHTRLEFSHPVRGPVVLGAGRYLGMGLTAPEAV